MACFVPTRKDSLNYGVTDIANIFFNQWVYMYVLLEDIMSDCDEKF